MGVIPIGLINVNKDEKVNKINDTFKSSYQSYWKNKKYLIIQKKAWENSVLKY